MTDVVGDVVHTTESTGVTELRSTTETIVTTASHTASFDAKEMQNSNAQTVVLEETSGDVSRVVRIDAAPAIEQAEFLSDEELTYEEYEQAFQSFSNCVQAAGHDFRSVWTDQETGQIHYTYRDESLGVVDQCYFVHFADVDVEYQTTNPAVLQKQRSQDELFFEFVQRPCLEDNGVAIPDGVTALEDDEGLFRRWVFLDMDGLCADRELPPQVLDQLQS